MLSSHVLAKVLFSSMRRSSLVLAVRVSSELPRTAFC